MIAATRVLGGEYLWLSVPGTRKMLAMSAVRLGSARNPQALVTALNILACACHVLTGDIADQRPSTACRPPPLWTMCVGRGSPASLQN